jgi:hemerythrin-like metal-binding protein
MIMKDRIIHYLLDHSEIDEDHKFLLMALDNLKRSAVGRYISDAEVLSHLDFIEDRANKHFEFEENLMHQIKYPYTEGHIVSHRLVRWYFDRARKYVSGYSIGDIVEDFLKHIDSFDRELIRWMKDNASLAQQ